MTICDLKSTLSRLTEVEFTACPVLSGANFIHQSNLFFASHQSCNRAYNFVVYCRCIVQRAKHPTADLQALLTELHEEANRILCEVGSLPMQSLLISSWYYHAAAFMYSRTLQFHLCREYIQKAIDNDYRLMTEYNLPFFLYSYMMLYGRLCTLHYLLGDYCGLFKLQPRLLELFHSPILSGTNSPFAQPTWRTHIIPLLTKRLFNPLFTAPDFPDLPMRRYLANFSTTISELFPSQYNRRASDCFCIYLLQSDMTFSSSIDMINICLDIADASVSFWYFPLLHLLKYLQSSCPSTSSSQDDHLLLASLGRLVTRSPDYVLPALVKPLILSSFSLPN